MCVPKLSVILNAIIGANLSKKIDPVTIGIRLLFVLDYPSKFTLLYNVRWIGIDSGLGNTIGSLEGCHSPMRLVL